MSQIEIDPQELMEAMRPRAGLLLVVGIVQAFLGTAAIAAPQVATPIGVEFLGVMLLLAVWCARPNNSTPILSKVI